MKNQKRMTNTINNTESSTASIPTKRIMTSAIPGVSVGEVRKAVADIRRKWEQRSLEHPFYSSDLITVEEGSSSSSSPNAETRQVQLSHEMFALNFIMGHHNKRHPKLS
jgi:hypothetical protein